MPNSQVFDPAKDTALMREAMKFLDDRHVLFSRKTAFQLKKAKVSYYPDRGTIYVDGEPNARSETGLQELLLVIAPDHDDSKAYSVLKKTTLSRNYQANR